MLEILKSSAPSIKVSTKAGVWAGLTWNSGHPGCRTVDILAPDWPVGSCLCQMVICGLH